MIVSNKVNKSGLLFEGPEWDFKTISSAYEAIAEIAERKLKLDIYPNQIEIITSEQMLDSYSSSGLPLMYRHWSFGKRFVHEELLYRKGTQGLAYEIVINSNPCIVYIMEENNMTMQTLVMAHAAFGHNHFFKNNYLFKQWTDADGLLSYLAFARDYVARCEERYGIASVERILDVGHSLMDQGVNRYLHQTQPSIKKELERQKERHRYQENTFRDLWRTLPERSIENAIILENSEKEKRLASARRELSLPEENLLYFLEKNAPLLDEWQRDILSIIRNIAQYMYPQKQTKMMNEGCATFVHYKIMNQLHAEGRISDAAMLEFLHMHTSVIFQPGYDDPRYSGINPYALGFAMMRDIERICLDPDEEDKIWFSEIAGNGDPFGTLRNAWDNYRDESFILQFLSPRVMREFRFFHLCDTAEEDALSVNSIHDEQGYNTVREVLAKHYDLAFREPDIQVTEVDLAGDRCLALTHRVLNGILLDEITAGAVLANIADLWGYPVKIMSIDAKTGKLLATKESKKVYQ